MSGNHEMKVQQLVNKVKGYGQPMYFFLQVITWELPSAWATVFAACSILYVILYNLSVKTFSVLGLLVLWFDYYCRKNNIGFGALTQTDLNHLHLVCAKLVLFQTKVTETLCEFKAAQSQNPNFKRNISIFLSLAILASLIIDNLLLCYLIGSTALPLMGMFFPQTDLM